MMNSFFKNFGLIATTSFVLATNVAYADEVQSLDIDLKASHYIDMHQNIDRIAVGSPEVATVVQLPESDHEFLIVTHGAGSTTLFVWTVDGQMHKFIINVSPEDIGKARVIEKAINLPNVHVKFVDNRALLTGTVKNQYERNYAIQTARLFVGGSSESSLSVGSGIDVNYSDLTLRV